MAGYIGSRTNNALVSLSGATGTISDDVVFPAGYIRQTTQNTYNSANSATTTSGSISKVSDGASNYHWSHTISNMVAGNDVLVHMNFTGYISRLQADAGGSWHIYRDSTLIYSAVLDYQFYINAAGRTGGTAIESMGCVNLNFLDTGATATSHVYYLGYSSYNSTNVVVLSDSNRHPYVCILQEIQA